MLDEYQNLTQTQQNTFKEVANKLLANTFLCRDKADNKENYYFVVSFKSLFEEFFNLLGDSIEVDQNLGTVQLVSSFNPSILKLNRDQTVVLLILRILYSENLKETTLNNNIVINVEDIQNKYNYLEIKQHINKTDLVRALRLFRRLNLIEVIGLKDALVANTKVILLPTLLCAIKTQDINEVHQAINHIVSEASANEEAN
ncbi:MAG: DUF4194 domain-containing protein [Acholeplasmatales bacterium]|nr:DUF4194 domain-containing protein [Acholeplasmatales bacterium]